MKRPPVLLAILLGMVAAAAPSEAQDYPWCALYAKDGDTHCFFMSYEQCMATVSGIGGFCQHVAVPAAPARPRNIRGR